MANYIYIDSPCGVGFSYGGVPHDEHNSDNGTAIDTYVFLQEFFEVTKFRDKKQKPTSQFVLTMDYLLFS